MTNKRYSGYYMSYPVFSYKELSACLEKLDDYWIYRAQPIDKDLETSLELECLKSSVNLEDAPFIEEEMIRQFRRVYDGNDRQKVQDDTLYCLSLIRHYEAPARLLDFTYSKYIASYFATECAYDLPAQENGMSSYNKPRKCAIWCINTK